MPWWPLSSLLVVLGTRLVLLSGLLAVLDGPSDHAEVRDSLLTVAKDGRGFHFEIP